VHFVGEFSTADLLDVQQVPTDEHALQDAVREWLDRLAIAWPSALLKNDAAQGFRSPLSVWDSETGQIFHLESGCLRGLLRRSDVALGGSLADAPLLHDRVVRLV